MSCHFICRNSLGAGEFFWIGLSDEARESDFRWVNNAPLYYQRFQSSNPDQGTAQNCVAIYADNTWHDDDCPDLAKILCSTLGIFCIRVFPIL